MLETHREIHPCGLRETKCVLHFQSTILFFLAIVFIPNDDRIFLRFHSYLLNFLIFSFVRIVCSAFEDQPYGASFSSKLFDTGRI